MTKNVTKDRIDEKKANADTEIFRLERQIAEEKTTYRENLANAMIHTSELADLKSKSEELDDLSKEAKEEQKPMR